MCDPVTPTIKLLNICIDKYTDFCAFKDECVTFRQSLCNVIEVLEDVQREIAEGKEQGNTRLRRPMELLQAAATEGGEVLRKCSAKRTLMAFVFSRQLMGMLNKAKGDIHEAMRLLQVSSVRIQVSTRRVMDSVSDRLDELHKQINASYTSKHEVADLIRKEMQQHRESHGASLAVAMSDVLVKMGVVSSAQDCADQFLELRKEADSIRKAKVIYDEEMLEAVKALTAPPANSTDPHPGLARPQRQGSETSSAVQECMVCPISGDIMHDPVTVVESGLTYDRKSLCTSLLMYPDLEPGTGQRFDRPLHYTPSIAVRSMITAQHGDSYYKKHDDTDFKEQYEAKWKELASPPPSVIAVKDQWGSFTSMDAGSVLTEPTSGATLHSDGRHHSDLGVCISAGGGDGSELTAAARSGAKIPGITFGGSEETDRVDSMNTDADDVAEAAKPPAAIQLGNKLTVCWRSRRARWLVAGAVLFVVLAVIVGIVVGSIKPGPPSPSPSSSVPSSSTSSPATSPAMTPAEKFTSTLPPYTTESLQDTSSPQYRAYELVTQSDQVTQGDEATRLFRMTQRFALATLFYSFGLDGWVEPSKSECEWGNSTIGSRCNADAALVVVAPVETFVLTPIPREIGLLTNLDYLDLFSNSLTSSIPTELGHLSALTLLALGRNALTSSIPTELGKLSALMDLDLQYNALNSSIPPELGELTNLTHLDLSYNNLTSIPTDLGELSALTYLDLRFNLLSSSIPTELGRLSALTLLNAAGNYLTSSIPTELGLLSDLTFLNLINNYLSSSIPTELGRLSALTGLHLHTNTLVSSIPTELGGLFALKTLYLYSNSLVSSIPTELGRLSSTLDSLLLQSNHLTGSFPSGLCNVAEVQIDCAEVACSCCASCSSA